MNTPMNPELTKFVHRVTETVVKNELQFAHIRKTEVLTYYRVTKLAFLNLGSMLISQTDGRLYIFNESEDLVFVDQFPV